MTVTLCWWQKCRRDRDIRRWWNRQTTASQWAGKVQRGTADVLCWTTSLRDARCEVHAGSVYRSHRSSVRHTRPMICYQPAAISSVCTPAMRSELASLRQCQRSSPAPRQVPSIHFLWCYVVNILDKMVRFCHWILNKVSRSWAGCLFNGSKSKFSKILVTNIGLCVRSALISCALKPDKRSVLLSRCAEL